MSWSKDVVESLNKIRKSVDSYHNIEHIPEPRALQDGAEGKYIYKIKTEEEKIDEFLEMCYSDENINWKNKKKRRNTVKYSRIC